MRPALALPLAAVTAAVIALAIPASAGQSSPQQLTCPAWLPHGVTSGHVSLVKWSLNRHAGVAATIYTTEFCAPRSAFSRKFERYLDHANLLRKMPAGIHLVTKTPTTAWPGP